MKVKLLILIAVSAVTGLAELMLNTPITDLYQRSDIVFIGRALSVRALTPTGAATTDWAVDFVPLRIYKGNAAPRIISVTFPAYSTAWGTPAEAGGIELVFASFRPGGDSLYLTEQQAFFALDLAPVRNPDFKGLEALEADATTVALGGGPLAVQAMRMMARFPGLSNANVKALSAHGTFADSDMEAMRLEALARADTPRNLSALAAFVATRESLDADGEPLLFHTIADLTGPNDIDLLKSLTNASSQDVRLAAMVALRRLRQPKTVEFLVIKLRASNSLEAYEALMGLAEITGRTDLATDLGTFEKQPGPHIEAWEKWSRTPGAAQLMSQ